MLSLRSFTRALPRSIPTISAHYSKRTLSTLPRVSLLQQLWKPVPRSRLALFSTSRIAWEKEGQVDQELAAKLESELVVEKGIRDLDQLPPSLKDFLDSSPFKLEDTPGHEEVALTRQFGDESIRVTFSVADLNAMDQDPDQYADDKAQFDESEEPVENTIENAQSGGAQSKGTIIQGRTKDGNLSANLEDCVGTANQPESMDDAATDPDQNQEPSFPARVNITIEKPGKGAMQIETVAQDGEIDIENVYYFTKGELADAKTAELDWSKRNLYSGPPFGNLDEELQILLERYLDERGINTAMALWVPEYIDFKEQREYLDWLSNLKSFVDA